MSRRENRRKEPGARTRKKHEIEFDERYILG